MYVSENGADRILDAVGLELQNREAQRWGLIVCLELAWQWYCSALTFSSEKPEKDRVGHLDSARKTAKKLEELLASDETWQSLFAPSPPDESLRPAISQLVEVLDSRLAEEEEEDGPLKAYQRSFKTRSPFEWLVGNFLPDIYDLIFFKEPGLSKSGPFIRFAEAVLKEFGIKRNGKAYSRASITRALTNDRSGRTRRKKVDRIDELDPYRNWRRQLLIRALTGPPD